MPDQVSSYVKLIAEINIMPEIYCFEINVNIIASRIISCFMCKFIKFL